MLKIIQLIRPNEVMKRRSVGHSKLYDEIAKGLWPPFIKIGRSSIEPEHEVNVMLAAIVAGATDDERRQLVQQLVAQRKSPAHPASAA